MKYGNVMLDLVKVPCHLLPAELGLSQSSLVLKFKTE